MLESLRWRPDGETSDISAQLRDLRFETLRLFLYLATGGYILWHLVSTSMWGNEHLVRLYTVTPFVVVTLAATYLTLPRSRKLATVLFLGGGIASTTWAIYVLESRHGVSLYIVLALAAAFLIHPMGGFAVVAVAAGFCAGLGVLRPEVIGPGDMWSTFWFGSVAVVGVWVLTHRLHLALTWYVDSFAIAERRTREAEEHRGELVGAWKQLDAAYDRLERITAALQLAWKAADVAERSKMEMATAISHELRTPVNLIAGYSEMMLTSPGSYGGAMLPPTYRGDLSAIYRGAQHLLALTDDVIDLARLETGRISLVRESVDLLQVIRDSAGLVSDFATAKGIDLRLAMPDQLPALILDRMRIRQVLLNLLTNAARLTEHGEIAIEVIEESRRVVVRVVDTGPGMDDAQIALLFQPFQSNSVAPPNWHTGSGLGLPISKTFVELHGGEMGVESVPGAGTTVWFSLPLQMADGFAPARGGAWRSAPLVDPGRTIVLAGGDARLAAILQRQLGQYRIELVEDPAEIPRRAIELGAAAVLDDIQDPRVPLDGLVPVVRCPLPRAERIVEHLGIDDYLMKPVSREALLAAVTRVAPDARRILVVDDDAPFVWMIGRMLESEGGRYEILPAHSGEEALERMRADRPDLVLLDLGLPGLDGFGVLARMAELPEMNAAMRVIILSAQGEGDGGVPLGTEFSITKPEGFRLAELSRVIDACVTAMSPVRSHLLAREPALPEAPTG